MHDREGEMICPDEIVEIRRGVSNGYECDVDKIERDSVAVGVPSCSRLVNVTSATVQYFNTRTTRWLADRAHCQSSTQAPP